MKTEKCRKIAAAHGEEFKSAYGEVIAYLRRLEKAGVVYQKPGTTFYMVHDFKKRLKTALTEIEEVEANRAGILEAFTVINVLVKPGGGSLPDFGEWLQKQAERRHMSVRKLLADENLVHEIEEHLREISNVIEKRADGEWEALPKDVMDLRIIELVDRLMQAWDDGKEGDANAWRAIMETP